MADATQKTNIVARTLFIIGGIILFIVLVVFIFKLIPILVSGISSAFGFRPKASEKIVITTNIDVAQNQKPLMVSFEYTPEQTGQYFISYSCKDGLFFDIQSTSGPRRIICDTPFKLGTNLSSITLVPVITKPNSFLDSTLTIEYKDEQNNPVDFGTKVITITTEGGITATSTQAENPFDVGAPLAGSTVTTSSLPATTQTQPSTTVARPTYVASPIRDLTITTIYPLANQSAFVMHVYNYGNTATGPWTFNYTNAENPSQTISSPIQGSLGAGQGMAVTVRFDGQVNSSQTIVVTVNPYNQISETNTLNNTSTVSITGQNSNWNWNWDWNDSDDYYNSDDRADLVITSMEVGRISGSRFIQTRTIDKDDTGAVRFVVANKGGESTGSWRYEIEDLPFTSNRDQTYRSPTQASLRPGEYRELIVEFDGMREGDYDPEVFVDSENDVREERENNNRESERLEVER